MKRTPDAISKKKQEIGVLIRVCKQKVIDLESKGQDARYAKEQLSINLKKMNKLMKESKYGNIDFFKIKYLHKGTL